MNNPFKQAFVTMYFPPDKAATVSVRGFLLSSDNDERSVEVPTDLAAELESHGLSKTPFAAPEGANLKIPTLGKK